MELAYDWHQSEGTGNRERNNVVVKEGSGPIVDPESGNFRLRDDFDYPADFAPFDAAQAGLDGTATVDVAAEDLAWTGGVLHYTSDAFEKTGDWESREATGMWGLFVFRFLMAGPRSNAAAVFQLPIDQDGVYDVYLYFNERNDLSKQTAVTVRHANGEARLALDQTRSGNWPKLGRWRFNAGEDNRVEITAEGANGPVVVDSVGFVRRNLLSGGLE